MPAAATTAAATAAPFSFGGAPSTSASGAFSFGGGASATSTSAFSFGGGAPSSLPEAAGAAGAAADDDEGDANTELTISAAAAGECPIPLLANESVTLKEARAKLMRFVPGDKSWVDAGGVGTLRVLRGGPSGMRLVVSQDVGTREKVVLSIGGISGVTLAPSADKNKPGGLTFVAAWAGKDGAAVLTKFLVKVRTAGQEGAIAQALAAS